MTPPPSLVAWNRPRALLVLGLFWAGEAMLGVGLGAVMIAEAKTMPAWTLALALLLSGFLAAVGLRLSVWCLRQIGRGGPVLAIGAEGLFDRRLLGAPVPWAEVTRLDIYHARGVQVMFDLSPAADAGVMPFSRRMARLNRIFGLPGYAVSLMGTDASDIEVARAMHAWHAVAHPAGG